MDLLPRTWKKEKKTGVPVFVIFSFLINTDTALSWSLYDRRTNSSGDYEYLSEFSYGVNNPELV